MKKFNGLMLAVAMSLMMMTAAAFAKDKNHHSVEIPETVKVGAGQLAPGKYTMEWSENGATAEVDFLQDGNSVLRTPAKVVNLSQPAASDAVTIDDETGRPRTLEEVEFGGHKQAFSFGDSQTGE
jgi:hypothetical protein